jgi:uncharacterized protein
VAHAYNLLPDNIQDNPEAQGLRDLLIALHQTWNPPGVGLGADEQETDWPIDVLAKTLFVEADVDLACFHTLRLDSYMKDGLCRHEKTLEAVTKYPDRFLGYVGVDPTAGLDVCLRELDEQLEDIPNPVGLKLYPSQVAPYRSWRMDDPTLAFPLFERVLERGISTVAIHKAAPLGPVPMDPYRVGDVDGAAGEFPGIDFEIIHSGLAFVTETAWALARYPNIYANFEITSSLAVKAPGLFEQVVAEFLLWGGPEKLIFSDGTMVFHTQPILDKIRDLEFTDETLEKFGIEQWDHEQKRLFLGGNYARNNGIDIEVKKDAIKDDEFSRERGEIGLAEPYSHWRKHLEQSGELVSA